MASYRDTRSLVDGAFMAGITAVLGLVGMFIPPLFLIISIIMPIPLAVLVRRRDLKVALLALVVTGLLMMVLYPDPLQVLVMFIQFGPLGLVLGLLYKNYVSPGHALLTASVVSILSSVTVISLSVLLTGLNLEMIQKSLTTSMQQAFLILQQAGNPVPEDQKELFLASVKTSVLLLPAAYVIYSIIFTILAYVVGGKVLRRLNYKVNLLPPFSQWRLPWYSIWGIILGLIFLLIGQKFGFEGIKILGQNVLTVFGFAFFVLGLTVFFYYYKVLPLTKGFKTILLVLLIFYVSFMYFAVVLLGVLDVIFNLRRPIPKKEV